MESGDRSEPRPARRGDPRDGRRRVGDQLRWSRGRMDGELLMPAKGETMSDEQRQRIADAHARRRATPREELSPTKRAAEIAAVEQWREEHRQARRARNNPHPPPEEPPDFHTCGVHDNDD